MRINTLTNLSDGITYEQGDFFFQGFVTYLRCGDVFVIVLSSFKIQMNEKRSEEFVDRGGLCRPRTSPLNWAWIPVTARLIPLP